MGNVASEVFLEFAFHFPQRWDGVTVLPVTRGPAKQPPQFISLAEAMEAQVVEITEKGESAGRLRSTRSWPTTRVTCRC